MMTDKSVTDHGEPDIPDYSSQVRPQQLCMRSTTEDEQVVLILVQMYRERVFMSHNRSKPFDQPLLLERCAL